MAIPVKSTLQLDGSLILPIGAGAGKVLVSDASGNASWVGVEAWRVVGAVGQPAFQNSWVNYDASTQSVAAFYKDPFDVVHMRGLIKNGSYAAAAFTLPSGYRPADKSQRWAVMSNQGLGYVEINTSGEVLVQSPPSSNVWVDLSPITFRAS